MAFESVLVTNDDGLDAAGLGALVAALSERYRVRVVAPDRERSGVSHAFTLQSPLQADEVPERFPSGLAEAVYRTTGTPADCVKLGLLALFQDDPPDLVVSGINRGANLGPDVLYSGTVAGALEGLLNGLPALAVSLVLGRGDEDRGSFHAPFDAAATWAVRLLGELEEELLRGREEGWCLNVNVPSMGVEELTEWRFTDLARARYEDRFRLCEDPSGRPSFQLEGELVLEDERSDCDVATVRGGIVSVTPLAPRLTHEAALARLQARG